MQLVDTLTDAIELKLREAPGGFSEFELIQSLRDDQTLLIDRDALSNHLGLFRTHFLLFHCLYRLRDQLLADQAGWLEIGPLSIRILPYTNQPAGLQEQDKLRLYYLDISHLTDTTEDDVESLLDQFWQRFAGMRPALDGAGRAEALEVLGLEDPVDDATIKKRFRSLAMTHHPDRGGDEDTLKTINQAMRVLIAG